jgi:hypothetical protein
MIQFINRRCPYCKQVFNAGKNTKTNIYKHIRYFAIKPPEKRGNHPDLESDAYKEVALRFRKIAKSPEKRRKITAASKKRSCQGVEQTGLRSVSVCRDLIELEVKKEDEVLSLQLSFEVRERIAKAFRNLLYSPDACLFIN